MSFLILLLWTLTASSPPAARADDWAPVTPADLALKDDPLRPGAHAVILYREVYSNHQESEHREYVRLKILTEEGKKYGNIEIPYAKGINSIRDLKARTIRPDGSVVPFEAAVFDKTLVRHKRLRVQAKTFSFPEVEVGSILEYRYRKVWDSNWLISPDWQIQDELSLLKGEFRVKPYSNPYSKVSLHWLTRWVPPDKGLVEQPDKTWVLHVEDIPAFRKEEYMPPEAPLKMSVYFYYKEPQEETHDEFWQRTGKERRKDLDGYVGNRGEIRQAVAAATAPGDSPEEKLRKLYRRAQQIRNLGFERSKTEKEEKREKLKDNNNVKDVLQHGYGYGTEIIKLFVAFARAAGFDATTVRIVTRDDDMFVKPYRTWDQLNDTLAWVKAGDKEYYLDPGAPYTPFNQLAWWQTGVYGVRLDKDGGTFITTPVVGSEDAKMERAATLRLDEDGTLSGSGTVTYYGLEATQKRAEGLQDDDEQRLKDMEETIEGWLATGSRVEIKDMGDWDDPEKPLRIEFTLEVPGFAVSTGRRLLVPMGIFQSSERYPFQHAERLHTIYFAYPWREDDHLVLALPPGFSVEAVPTAKTVPMNAVEYKIGCSQADDGVHVDRSLVVGLNVIEKDNYPILRNFYDKVREGDEEQVVLQVQELGQR